MANIQVFSKSLASNAQRIDSIMAGVDGLMGKEGELQGAAKSFRELAENLDKRSAGEILELLGTLNTAHQKTIVMVTHDPGAAARAHRMVHLDKGVLSR